MCSHILLKERTQNQQVMHQKSGDTKTEAKCSCLLQQKKKKRKFCELKSVVTWQQQSTQGLQRRTWNLGTITDTQSRYRFSPLDGIRVEPKLHRRRRIIFKRLQKPSHEGKTYSYKQFIRMWQALYRIIMESSINYTSSITDKQNCRTNRTSSKRERHQPYYCNLDRMISGVSDSVEWYFLWQMVQQNYQEETANSKNPLWDGNLP